MADLLSRMTLEEKVGQMTQTERYQVFDDETPITTWKLGSILSGGGSTPTENTPEAWADMVDRFQRAALRTRLGIPLLYGIDAVHGNGNALGATVFPHNIGLGATRDPRLVKEIAEITAEETRAIGPQWTFSPCICAARDDRWGRTYESFSENPDLVTRMETAIDGYQGRRGDLADRDHVLATAKHYAGDGDTEYGTAVGDYTIDQGIAITNRSDFWDVSLRQYEPAVRDHRVGSVMPSFSSVDWTEDGVGNPIKMHANRELITDVLKGSMRFDGLVISDWEGIHQIPGDWPTQVRTGVNAGIDMMMEPNTYQSLHHHADRRGERRPRADEPDRRRGQPHPHQEVRAWAVREAVHRPPQPGQDRLARAPQGGPRGGREVVGAAEERARDPAAGLQRRRVRGGLERRQHRKPGRRLDDHVAGQLEPRDSRNHDPGRSPRRSREAP